MKKTVMKMQGKRFSWQKKRLILSLFLVTAVFFLIYQFIFMFLLGNSQNKTESNEELNILNDVVSKSSLSNKDIMHIFNNRGLIRGIKLSDIQKYKPDDNGMFTCFKSKVVINFSMVNDDYCDCPEDGSDEPGTNACNNGQFYCAYQSKHFRNKPTVIPSSRVNDGICDCCDGSDEWKNVTLITPLSLELQKKFGSYQTPCINYCLT